MVRRSSLVWSPLPILLVGMLGGCGLLFPFDPERVDTSSGAAGGSGGGGEGPGGSTSTGAAGGAGGTTSSSSGTMSLPASCKDALEGGMTASGVIALDLDGDAGNGAETPVYCDQVYDGGGWALVHNSVGDPRVSSLTVDPGALSLEHQKAAFAPATFDVTAQLVDALPNTGCSAITNDVAGKIALIDRGDCAQELKVANAQAAGALGVLIANNAANAPPHAVDDDTGVDATLPTYSITLEDGNTLEAMLVNGAVTVTMLEASGKTTAFWNIPYAERFAAKGTPALDENHYNGALYRHGEEYRDDAVDRYGTEVLGVLRATVTGIDESTMTFLSPQQAPGSLSPTIYASQLAAGWSSFDHDGDEDPANCAAAWEGVTQHYGTCWRYSLGADVEVSPEGGHADGGWGPHMFNAAIDEINTSAAGSGQPMLAQDGAAGTASRMTRISRFTRW